MCTYMECHKISPGQSLVHTLALAPTCAATKRKLPIFLGQSADGGTHVFLKQALRGQCWAIVEQDIPIQVHMELSVQCKFKDTGKVGIGVSCL
jgi:hypothetical protein